MLDISHIPSGQPRPANILRNTIPPLWAYTYTEGHAAQGHWHGKLAAEFGLPVGVHGEAFERVINGNHPITGEQLIGLGKRKRAKDGKE